jgi:hypothetical protein
MLSFRVTARGAVLAAILAAIALVVAPRSASGQPAAPVPATPGVQAASPVPVAFFGEVRSRSEWDQPGGGAPADLFTYLRSRFGVRVDAASNARVVLQVQDSRVLGAEGSPRAAAVESFDLHQGYAELSAPWRGVRVAARAGRQEIALGNERLVGAVNWSNVGRSFDGVRLLFAPRAATADAEPWTATAFAATVEERGRHFGGTAMRSADHAAAGVFVVRRLRGGVELDGTLLGDAGAEYREYRDADRVTLDARVRVARVLGVRAELEGAVQRGRQRLAADSASLRPQRIQAWLLAARLGTPTAPAVRTSLTVGVDALSGDATPDDGRHGAFATMYATNHPFYGLMDVVGDPAASTRDRGLVDVLATLATRLSPAVGLRAELHHFALASGRTRDLGWEADLVLPVRMGDAASVELSYGAFRAGPGAAAVALGRDASVRHAAHLQLRAGF